MAPKTAPAPAPAKTEEVKADATEEVKADVAEEPEDVSLSKVVQDNKAAYLTALKAVKALEKNLFASIDAMCKDYNKFLVKEQKKSNKAATSRTSGLAKPVSLSPDICKFLGVSNDTKMSRTDVTRAITSYIKEHGLADVSDKRKINLDDTLKPLMIDAKGETPTTVTYFNLQAMIKHHFIKE